MVIGFIYVCSQFLPSDSPWFPAWTWQILSLNPRILILELRILGPNKTHCEDAWHIFSMSLFPKFQVFTWSKKSTYFIKNVNYDVWFTAGSNLFLGFVPTFYLVPSVLSVARRHWRPQKRPPCLPIYSRNALVALWGQRCKGGLFVVASLRRCFFCLTA